MHSDESMNTIKFAKNASNIYQISHPIDTTIHKNLKNSQKKQIIQMKSEISFLKKVLKINNKGNGGTSNLFYKIQELETENSRLKNKINERSLNKRSSLLRRSSIFTIPNKLISKKIQNSNLENIQNDKEKERNKSTPLNLPESKSSPIKSEKFQNLKISNSRKKYKNPSLNESYNLSINSITKKKRKNESMNGISMSPIKLKKRKNYSISFTTTSHNKSTKMISRINKSKVKNKKREKEASNNSNIFGQRKVFNRRIGQFKSSRVRNSSLEIREYRKNDRKVRTTVQVTGSIGKLPKISVNSIKRGWKKGGSIQEIDKGLAKIRKQMSLAYNDC